MGAFLPCAIKASVQLLSYRWARKHFSFPIKSNCLQVPSVHSRSLLRFTVFILLLESLEDRAVIELHNLPVRRPFLVTLALRISLPHRAPWLDPCLKIKYGMDNVSFFSLVNGLVYSAANSLKNLRATRSTSRFLIERPSSIRN